jgi:hypothetical protein
MAEEYLLNIDDWTSQFTLETYYDNIPHAHITNLIGPFDFAIIEQLRRMIRDKVSTGRAVPADAFVLALGEPEFRHVTKIGGVPYRPAEKAWPACSGPSANDAHWQTRPPAGSPMTFLAQFCFAGSADFLGRLPGDVLLIFAEDRDAFDRPESVHFEWHPLGISDLVAEENVPQPGWHFVKCFGYRWRTEDYPDAKERIAECLGGRLYAHDNVPVLNAIKIGGVPFHLQRSSPNVKGRLLCQLTSILHFRVREKIS